LPHILIEDVVDESENKNPSSYDDKNLQ